MPTHLRRTWILPLLAAFTVVLTLTAHTYAGPKVTEAQNDKPARPVVGAAASEFTLPDIKGQEYKLSELTEESPVVLLVLRGYIGKQCPICNIQVGQYLSEAKAFADRGAKVVMVYPGPAKDLAEHAEDFLSGKGLPEHFVFLLDPDLSFTKQYDLRWPGKNKTAYPATFVINKGDQVVEFAHVSQSARGRIEPKKVLEVLDR